MTDDKKQIRENRTYDNMRNYRSNALQNWFYSFQRIDLLIVTISTGGIVILLSILGDKNIVLTTCPKVFLFLSLILFALTIIVNLFSQLFSAKANKRAADWALNEMEIINKQTEESESYNRNTCYGKTTKILNNISLYSLVAGILLSLIMSGIIIF